MVPGTLRMPSKAPGDGTVRANADSINVSNSGPVFKLYRFLMRAALEFSPRLTPRCDVEVLFICFLCGTFAIHQRKKRKVLNTPDQG